MADDPKEKLSSQAKRTVILLAGIAAVGMGWIAAEVIVPWWEQREMKASMASHAWSMSALEPGKTYELASFPVPPGQNAPPTFSVTLNTRGVREREFTERPAQGVVRVIAIGDSTTFGTGVPPQQRFSDVLQSLLDQAQPGTFEVLNCGKAGMTADAGRQFYEQQARAWGASIIIVGLGTNNLRNGQEPMAVTDSKTALDTYQNQLEQLARRAKEDGTLTILWSNIVLDNRGENTLRPFNDRMKKVAEKYAIPHIDLESVYRGDAVSQTELRQFKAQSPWTQYWPQFERVPLAKAALHSDMAHPNAAGFKRLAAALLPFVLDMPQTERR